MTNEGGIRCKLCCNNKSVNGVPFPVQVLISTRRNGVCEFTAKVVGKRNHETIKRRQLRGPERQREALICQSVKASERGGHIVISKW